MLHDTRRNSEHDLVAAISAALHDTFGRSKYANSVSQAFVILNADYLLYL